MAVLDAARRLFELKWRKQLIRYGLVGATTNLGGYLLFYLLTLAGMRPVGAISIMYPVVIGMSYLLNRKWSFEFGEHWVWPAVKYLIAYAACYGLNAAAHEIFYERLGYNELVVQALAICVLILPLFLTLRYWVFRTRKVEQTETVDESAEEVS